MQKTHVVVSPEGKVERHIYVNARDLVRLMGWKWGKPERDVLAVARREAEENSFIKGNDPRRIKPVKRAEKDDELDVEALVARYSSGEPVPLEDMSREQLAAYADEHGVSYSKRFGRDKLLEAIKSQISDEDETDEEEPESGEDTGESENDGSE